jgi:tetratricopeptide (TPR) repeat protein
MMGSISFYDMEAARLEKRKRKKARTHLTGLKKHRNPIERIMLLKRFFRWEMLIILAALICDGYSWGHQFVIDDHSYLVENHFIQNPSNLLRILVRPSVAAHLYRPLTALSLGANCWIHGLNPDGFHVINRLIHVMICLGIFWVLRHLISNSAAAFLTALLFAAHPIQTEAVTYIEGRADLLATLFFVLALFFHIRARQSAEAQRRDFAAALVFYFFAMLSKESGITWIAVVLVTEFVYFSKSSPTALWQTLRKGLWKIFAAYLLAPSVFLALRAFAFSQVPGAHSSFVQNPLSHVPVMVRELTGLKVLFQSLGLLLWPVRLSADYSYNQIPLITQWSSPAGLAVIALSLAFLLLLGWSYFRAPDIFFGLGYFLATYSVVSNLVVHIGTIRADRLLYMPSLGILLIVGTLLAGLDRRLQRPMAKKAFRLSVVVIVILLMTQTVRRNSDWQDEMTLWLQTVRTAPNSARAHHTLGSVLAARREFSLALEQYRVAESIYAEDAMLICDLGTVLSQLGRADEALQYYRRAVELDPQYPMIRFSLATALRARGDFEGAKLQDEAIIAFYDDLIRKNPSNADHHYFKAKALSSQGQLEQALSEYRRTLQIDPNYDLAKESIDRITRKMSAPDGGFRIP